ncbi:60S ribosomal protein L24 [Datura stramonium]|uniref:60S ribosomal protein L24 n=1 Tax=Datura stramonium TaxID=4076 RepID=A0ABS8S4W1_DATST|nr:60S ribosomal protein L24 [Datura stramonium]
MQEHGLSEEGVGICGGRRKKRIQMTTRKQKPNNKSQYKDSLSRVLVSSLRYRYRREVAAATAAAAAAAATAMVLKTELCRFSGAKIYPGRGIRFIRSDSQVFLFVNSKCKHYFHNRLKPSKLTWTAMYRKQHKKDIAQEAVKKRRRATKKPYSRSIVGATLEVIQKKRTERPEVRDAAREAALREIKERIKKTKDEKKAKKAEVTAKSQKAAGKGNVSKGGSKGPKLGGGGGKR